jgi:hypothetical protein
MLTSVARKTISLGPGVHTLRIEHISGGLFVLRPLTIEISDFSVLLAGTALCTASGTASVTISTRLAGTASCMAVGSASLALSNDVQEAKIAGLVTTVRKVVSLSPGLHTLRIEHLSGGTFVLRPLAVEITDSFVQLAGVASCTASGTAALTLSLGVESTASCVVVGTATLNVQEAGIAGLAGVAVCAAVSTAALGTGIPLAGSSSLVTVGTALLDVQEAGIVGLEGTATCAAVGSATLHILEDSRLAGAALCIARGISSLSVQAWMVLYIQHINGTVEAIPVISQLNTNKVLLSYAPSLPLVLDPNKRPTRFILSTEESITSLPFLMAEREPAGKSIVRVSAINYSPEYYKNDPEQVPEEEPSWKVEPIPLNTTGLIEFVLDGGLA